MKHGRPSRRQLLQMGAAVGGSLFAGQEALALDTDPRQLGEPLGPYSERSPFEKAVRWRRSSFTPLHDSVGMVTPFDATRVKMPNRDGFVADPRPDIRKERRRQ